MTQEAALPRQRLARLMPLTVAKPACWSLETLFALDVEASAGCRLTQEAAVKFHRLALSVPAIVAFIVAFGEVPEYRNLPNLLFLLASPAGFEPAYLP